MHMVVTTLYTLLVCVYYLIHGIGHWCSLWHIQHRVLKRALLLFQILPSSLSEHRHRGQGSLNILQAEVEVNFSHSCPHVPILPLLCTVAECSQALRAIFYSPVIYWAKMTRQWWSYIPLQDRRSKSAKIWLMLSLVTPYTSFQCFK